MRWTARTFLALLLAAGASQAVSPPLCTVHSPLDAGRLRFEASDGQELLSAIWAPRRDALSGCSLSAEPRAVSAFLSRCRRGEGPREDRPAFPSLREAKAACRPVQAPAGSGPRRRTKRGFTYPGTLWCGAGNIAESYDQLGAHQETDKCCREHDHCHHVIHPFTYKYGYRNFRWHTISHCDCDNRLKACLRAVNDTASRVVGQAFFNVIQVPCFEFTYQEQCVEPYLYVWCKNYSTVAIAVAQEPVLYDYGGQRIDWPATRRPAGQPSATATPDSSHTQPLVTPITPTQKAEPAILEMTPTSASQPHRPGKKRLKGRGKGRDKNRKKGKGLKKKRKKQVGTVQPSSLPIVYPLGEDSSSSPKDLDRQELGKVDFGAAAKLAHLGEEDPYNGILSDDPAGAVPRSGGDAAEEESKEPARQRTASGPSSVQTPKRKRKGRRHSQQGGGRRAHSKPS